jgi:methyl-accepting chemotaxis protein
MSWYLNTKIRFKIISAFIVVAFFALLIGYIGNTRLDLIMNMLVQTDQKTIPHIGYLYTISMNIRDIAINERSLVNPRITDEKMKKKFFENMQKSLSVIDTILQKKDDIFIDDSTKVFWRQVESNFSDWAGAHNEVIALVTQKEKLVQEGEKPDSKIISELIQQAVDKSLLSRQKYLKCSASLKTMIARHNKEIENKAIRARDEYTSAKITFLICTALGFIVAIGLGFFISRVIANPLYKLMRTAQSITEGRVNEKVELIKRDDEVGKLTLATHTMLETIRNSLEHTRQKELEALWSAEEANTAQELAETQRQYLSESSEKLLNEMKKFSNGDLSVFLESEKDDDIGKLYNGFNLSVKNINNLLKEVARTVQLTSTASGEISSSSEQMASGTQEQSSQTMEIAGSVQEMTQTIFEISKNLNHAAQNSKSASDHAVVGKVKIEETKKGMSKIISSANDTGRLISSLAKRTDQIGEITQVIDEIADQTNLLALNAAIEAARAGEQGRGFAIVAEEVRKLAERTTKATKEIATTIKSVQAEAKGADYSMIEAGKFVNNGMKLIEEVEKVFEEISKSNEILNQMISQVAAASEEQNNAAEVISKNIESIRNVTHETASGIQQIAQLAEDLNKLMLNLQELILHFRFEGSQENFQKNNSINKSSNLSLISLTYPKIKK